MTSIEGKRGEPRPRPPFPASQGPVGQAHRPQQRRDLRQHRRRSSSRAPTGSPASAPRRARAPRSSPWPARCSNTGLVEVPMGMPLGEIIYDIGGGIPDGKSFKAAQIGGPSGGCIPRQHLNVPDRLRVAAGARRHHGLRRPDRHGRGHLHGRHRPLLPGLHPGRELRQVPALPRRHQADARDPRPHLPRQGQGRRHRAPRSTSARCIKRHGALRPRPDGAEPGALAPSATSATSTRPTSRTTTARPASAPTCSRRAAPTPARRASTSRASSPSSARSATTRRCGCTASATRWPASAPASASTPARASACAPASTAPLAIRHLKRFMVEQEKDAAAARGPGQRREREAQGRRRRRRPGRPLVRLLPRPAGLQAGRLRGRAQGRRHARAGHPGLPPAARGARPRDQDDRRHGRDASRTARRWAGTSRSRASRTRATRPCSSASAPRRAWASASPARTAPACPTASPSSSSTTSTARPRWASRWR